MIMALHGFLGLRKDWDPFREMIRRPDASPHDWLTPDLWQLLDRAPTISAAAQALAAEAAASAPGRPWLLGYSMGGRLAMRAFSLRPDAFAGAIFLSANPGLRTDAERSARRRADEVWAMRFAGDEPWDAMMADWNAREAFAATEALVRPAGLFDRTRLARALRDWGLGVQPDLRAELAKTARPSLWISGARDAAFTETMKQGVGGAGRWTSIAKAGHRLLWDEPTALSQTIQAFLAEHDG